MAGQIIELRQMGKFSGKYLIKQARHDYSRSRGYTTDLEIKMIEYIEENKEQNNVQAA